MAYKIRNIFVSVIMVFFFSNSGNTQPNTGEFIQANIGIGTSLPTEAYSITGSGFYIQAEYIYAPKKWVGFRPYLGFITTNPNESSTDAVLQEFRVTSKAFLLGGKARICAPIPWIAPFIELGIGASLGSFETYTPTFYKKQNGLLMHIPYTLGLALGQNNNFEIAVTNYVHPSVEQFSSTIAIGITIPINQ